MMIRVLPFIFAFALYAEENPTPLPSPAEKTSLVDAKALSAEPSHLETKTPSIEPSQALSKATAPSLQAPSVSPKEVFQPFAGKVLGNKARLRCKADLESPVVKELSKGEFLLVVGEDSNFFKVKPPSSIKAFVFRSYLIDRTIEAHRVNVRLLPNTEAPIIGKLEKGETIEGEISTLDPKWLEIAPPKNTYFFIAKELITKAGNLAFFAQIQKCEEEAKHLLSSFKSLINEKSESQKEKLFSQLESFIKNYQEFPQCIQEANHYLVLLKEKGEGKLSSIAQKAKQASPGVIKRALQKKIKSSLPCAHCITKKMAFWQPIEHSLFVAWESFHPDQTQEDFYKEQKANAFPVSGQVERYPSSVKNRPGDFLLRNEEGVPIAYLYSTQVDLEKFVGKKVNLSVASRPCHQFAFPAYFVLSVE